MSGSTTTVTGENGRVKMVLIILAAVGLVQALVFSALANWESDDNPIFRNGTGRVSDKYHTEITPANWAFQIWSVIYLWQIIWVAYACSTICRRGIDGPLYTCPPYLPLAMYPIYTINQGMLTTWLIVWDRQELTAALVVLILVTLTNYTTLGLCFYGLYKYENLLMHNGLGREVWWVRLAVQNGLGMYSMWTTIASLLNLAIVLIYKTDKDPNDMPWREDVCTTCLSVLAVVVVVWVSLDLTVLDRITRFVFTPHLVVTYSLFAILDENWDTDSRNTYLALGMLGGAALATILKIVVIVWRQITEKKQVQHKHK